MSADATGLAPGGGGGGGRLGGSSKLVRPLQPLLGGGSPLSGGSSWVMESQSGSFASPAGRAHHTARSMATVESAFSESFSDTDDEERRSQGARGRVGSGESGVSEGQAVKRSYSRMSSRVSGAWVGGASWKRVLSFVWS